MVALKKVSVPSSPSDFRPIALLCFLSKVLEKLAYEQIKQFLRSSDILDPLQTGFRHYSSTETAMLRLNENIKMSKRLITVLLQFSQAFDKVSATTLLRRMKEMGICRSALIWLKSYLEDRQLKVTYKLSSSASRNINLGVPQGSVLGPLFFYLYMNIRDHLGPDVFHLLYADDLQVYIQVSPESIHEGIRTPNRLWMLRGLLAR